MTKQVYLIHFSKAYKHARHYVGFTSLGVKHRLLQHRSGTASPLTKAATANGSELVVVRVWNGDRHDERRLKKRGSAAKYCPICRGKGIEEVGEYLSVKRRTVTNTQRSVPVGNPGEPVSSMKVWNLRCKWCGNGKRRMYYYDDSGPFCDKGCCESYNGQWPYSAFGPLPVEVVKN